MVFKSKTIILTSNVIYLDMEVNVITDLPGFLLLITMTLITKQKERINKTLDKIMSFCSRLVLETHHPLQIIKRKILLHKESLSVLFKKKQIFIDIKIS